MQVYLKEPYVSPAGNYYTPGHYDKAELPSTLFKLKPHLVVSEKVVEEGEVEVQAKDYKQVDKLPAVKTSVKPAAKPKATVVALKEKEYPTTVKKTENV